MDLPRDIIITRQAEYCSEHDSPFFMPSNGRCWSCGRDILPAIEHLVDNELITGCPYCHTTYCG